MATVDDRRPPRGTLPLRGAVAVAASVACANAGDWAGVVALTDFVPANPDDLVAQYQAGGNPGTLRAVGDVRAHADGRVSADVVCTGLGGTLYQVWHERWYLVAEEGGLLLDDAEILASAVPAGADRAGMDVVMVDFAFEPAAPGVPTAEHVVLHSINRGRYHHEVEVKRLPPGATFAQVFADEALQARTVDIGYLELAPGAEGDLVLVGLEPGAYTLICFFDEPDGEPHALKGMVAEFTVG